MLSQVRGFLEDTLTPILVALTSGVADSQQFCTLLTGLQEYPFIVRDKRLQDAILSKIQELGASVEVIANLVALPDLMADERIRKTVEDFTGKSCA